MSLKEVFENINQTEQLPVIFAGSGVTKRYTTSNYNWEELLIKCISMYSDTPKNKYNIYKEKVKYNLMNNKSESKFSINEAIGTEIERDFNIAYFNGEINNLHVPDNNSPLKFYIAELLSEYKLNDNMQEEIKLLKQLQDKMLTIVTTNYDTFFEDYIFNKHKKIIGQDIFSKSEIGTLFKIHGCATEPDSIVITQRDYDTFKRKRMVLSAKLISLFTENPVIFIGYSLQDENIKSILTDIFTCIDNDDNSLSELEKRLIIINYDENVQKLVVGNHSLYIEPELYINLTKITLSSYLPLLNEMQNLTRKIKFRDVKMMEDLIYDIVHSKQGARTKLINTVDDDVDPEEVVTIITKKDSALSDYGIIGIERDVLFDDLLEDNFFHDNMNNKELVLKLLLEQQLDNLLRGNVAVPIHKYLSMVSNLEDIELGDRVKNLQNKGVRDYLNKGILKCEPEFSIQKFDNFDEILKSNFPQSKKHNFLILHAANHAKANEIKEFILAEKELILQPSNGNTNYRKLACIYDIKKYKSAQ